jgi:peptidoglycan/xylan/chitin deacetylase (PgdA/CDA1 family)
MSGTTSPRRPAGPLRQLRAAAGPWAKTALLRLGGYAALRRAIPSRGLAILRYHAICGPEGYEYADPYICVTPDNFERHIAYLTSAYHVMRLDDAAQMLAERQPLPVNAVAITFDDGYADNLDAARILAKYGASATFYLTAGCLDGGEPFWPVELRYVVRALPARKHTLRAGAVEVEIDLTRAEARHPVIKQLTKVFKSHPVPVRDALREQLRALAGPALSVPRVMLNWDEVREMHRLGMTIGSHTMTHPNLPSAGIERAREELVDSRRRLEHEISAPVTMFSYPNGGAERYLTPDIQRIVREVGYAAASTSHNSFATEASDIFALERIEVEERVEDLAFALEVERFAFKPVNPAMYR